MRDGLDVLLQASEQSIILTHADNGAVALPRIIQDTPHFILLDIGLNDESTWQVLQHIQTHWPHIRCCLLTHTEEQARRAWNAGADAVLPAGFAAEAFFKMLRELI